mgnify:CR=1 FL=1
MIPGYEATHSAPCRVLPDWQPGLRPRARGWRSRTVLALTVAVLLLGLLPAPRAAAHPLGNFTVNQYSRIDVATDTVQLHYVLDLAELPTVADRALVDPNGDGTIADAERNGYLDDKLAEVLPDLRLAAGGTNLTLRPGERSLAFLPGQAGLAITRIEADFSADLPAPAAGALTYRNDYAADRIGWREIVVTHGPDITFDAAADLAVDRSDALRSYPTDMLSSPLDERSVLIPYRISPGAPASNGTLLTAPAGPAGISERLNALVNGATLSTTGLILALLAAAAWGALHSLSPGHGKTVVGAYLVGSRGTPRHALFLGLTVTVTHTAGVIALGLVILFASRTIMPEQLYPWLTLASGLMVVAIGLTIFRQRLLGLPIFGQGHHHAHEDVDHHHHHHEREHEHDQMHAHGIAHSHGGHGHSHSHLPPGAAGERVTWRDLLALGVSGGLIPCPSALLALLGALAVGRPGLGLAVVVAFSVGLAATLTGIGLLFLYAGRFLERRARSSPLSGFMRYAPVAGALAVTSSGVLIAARAVLELQRMG